MKSLVVATEALTSQEVVDPGLRSLDTIQANFQMLSSAG